MLRHPHFIDRQLTDGIEGASDRVPQGRFQDLICVKRLTQSWGYSAGGMIRVISARIVPVNFGLNQLCCHFPLCK